MKKWLILLTAIFIVFRGAFSTYIFQDDFYNFGISKAASLQQFLDFFSPLRQNGFYRPFGTQIFYFTAGILNNLVLTRFLVFSTFFLGLIFLYKSTIHFVSNKKLAFLFIFIYMIHFSHIYQLYWLSTFQEVAVFTFCSIAFYFFWQKKIILSLMAFLIALLSREEALVLPFFITLVILFDKKYFQKIYIRQLFLMFLFAAPFFYLLYFVNFQNVAIQPEYKPQITNIRLIFNNILWYGLWSLGFPSFAPDFWPTILKPPNAGFWARVNDNNAGWYLVFLAINLGTMIAGLIKENKKIIKIAFFVLVSFLVFVLPMSIIVHKWLVRLTIPAVFTSFLLAFLIYNSRKPLAILLLGSYILYNLLAIPVHENTSTYKYESSISLKAKNIISNNNCLYFADDVESKSGWEGSQKLKLTLFDQWFTKYYRPDKNIKVYYGFENKVAPEDCTIINSRDLL